MFLTFKKCWLIFLKFYVAFSEYLNFKGLIVEKFLASHNEIFPKFDILMCNVLKYTYIHTRVLLETFVTGGSPKVIYQVCFKDKFQS